MDNPPTVTVTAAADLATALFNIANIVVGFHVVQTILFLNSLGQQTELRNALSIAGSPGRRATWYFCAVYAGIILCCSILEAVLRSDATQDPTVRYCAMAASAVRFGLVLGVGCLCQYVYSNLRPCAPKADPR